MAETTAPLQLANVRNAVAQVTKGKAIREDDWLTTWCSTSWGDLIQPAPLSISLLGSLLILASSIPDFNMTESGAPEFEWKYADHPESFKTTLQQLVGAGYTAFETVHGNMESIKNLTGQMPTVVSDLVRLVLTGTPEDLEDQFSNMVEDLKGLSDKCMKAAQKSELAFQDITGLSQELALACIRRIRSAEQARSQTDAHIAVLEAQKAQESKMVDQLRQTTELMTKSYAHAEDQFQDAVRNFPTGWDLIGMQIVEALTSQIACAGNAVISQATMSSQAVSSGVGAFKGMADQPTGYKETATASDTQAARIATTTSPTGISTQPTGEALCDPAVTLAQTALAYFNAAASLIGRGKPDWSHIYSQDPRLRSEVEYLKTSFESLKLRLDPSKPVSPTLINFCEAGITILGEIITTSKSVDTSNDGALQKFEPRIAKLISELEGLVTTCNLILQQPGVTATGPATPVTPANINSGASRIAVESAEFKVNSARAALESARESFQKASNQLMSQQKDITRTIKEVAKLSVTASAHTLNDMLVLLEKAIGCYTTLRAQFSQLGWLFSSISNLLNNVFCPSIPRWIANISARDDKTIAGITTEAFTRDLIYRQCQTMLKVATLVEQISTTYNKVSESDIMPAQRKVGHMLKFSDSDTEADQRSFIAELRAAQTDLASQAEETSLKIYNLMEADRARFAALIDKRLTALTAGTSHVIPSVVQPIPGRIKAIQDSYVVDFVATKKARAEENPMFGSLSS